MRIGLVEDSPALSVMLKDGLEANGHAVTLYENEQEAIKTILEARYDNQLLAMDLLIIDMGMAQGRKTVTYIRQFVPASILPIIILNDFSSRFHVTVLEKPVALPVLLQAVKEKGTLPT